MKVNILGTAYQVVRRTEKEDANLSDCLGYCDWTAHRIVIAEKIEGSLFSMKECEKKVLRHEIVHAFLVESGLHECSGEAACWAANEEMVDWFARQGMKIYKAWKEAGAL